ncbi:MAG: hypothetical protein HFE59_08610 [Clostridiales bacterium]|nr:hypothetical protein [Clostridiales bacterium]
MKWFKELLEKAEIKDGKLDIDEIIKKAETEFSQNAVSIEEFNLLKKKFEQAETDIKNRDKQLEELKKVDVDEMREEITKLQRENKENREKSEADIKEMRISHAVDMVLVKEGVKGDKAMAAVKALLSLENAELDGDVIKGLDKQIKDLKADTSVGALFGAAASGAKFRGAKPDESGDRPPKGKDVNNMSYEELCAYMEANPENTVIN